MQQKSREELRHTMKSGTYLLSLFLAISMFCCVVAAQQGASTPSSQTVPREGKTPDPQGQAISAALAQENSPSTAQVMALDECDPATFNAALGADFCKNVALGAFTTFDDLFAEAAAGTPDAKWDFEPDTLSIKKGTAVTVVDQGGEPHTFTEVAQFGGGFVEGLNGGEPTVPECAGGFATLAVAKTRILQGSHVEITGLSKGTHRFECCIHPWMRVKVDVK
jgi:plastocyanin